MDRILSIEINIDKLLKFVSSLCNLEGDNFQFAVYSVQLTFKWYM